jgi:hypothetical protein
MPRQHQLSRSHRMCIQVSHRRPVYSECSKANGYAFYSLIRRTRDHPLINIPQQSCSTFSRIRDSWMFLGHGCRRTLLTPPFHGIQATNINEMPCAGKKSDMSQTANVRSLNRSTFWTLCTHMWQMSCLLIYIISNSLTFYWRDQ